MCPAGTVPSIIKWYKKKYGDSVQCTLAAVAVEQPTSARCGKELKEASLKITALEMLIENAGKELGVDLVKKFRTKQPKK